jgi:putative aldouronate transport system permease protein
MSAFAVSVSRTLVIVFFGCFFTSLLAYAMTRKSLPGRSFFIFYFYFTTLFSGGLIPTYIMYRQMDILNTFYVLVLPGIYSFFYMIILRTFFYTIPESLQESARIDGASEVGIYFRIMLPLSVPAMATIALFFGVNAWNDWFAGEYFVSRRRDIWPAATLLRDLLSQATFETNPQNVDLGNTTAAEIMVSNAASITPESLRMAFLIVLTAPIMCVYPFLQKFFVSGIMIGSLKE